MGTRVHFNPNTLKAHYTVATKKAQVFPCICALCATVPWEITVTLADIIDLTDCCVYGTDSQIYNGGLAAVLNGEHILTCSVLTQSSCCWSKRVTGGSFGTIEYHAGTECNFFLSSVNITTYNVVVIVYESAGTKYTQLSAGPFLRPTFRPGTCFDDALTFVDVADCLNVGNTFTNELACAKYVVGTGGTGVISL